MITSSDLIKKETPARSPNYPTLDQIIKSRVIAKAIIQREGEVVIVAAFQLSYQYAFWFEFRARTSRSPQRTWRLVNKYLVRGFQGAPMHLDEIIKRVLRSTDSGKITRRYPVGKRNFIVHLDRIANPMKYLAPIPTGASFQTEYYNRRHSGTRSRWGR